jgi:hypothetical protein
LEPNLEHPLTVCVTAAAVAVETTEAVLIVCVVAPPPLLIQMMITSVTDVLDDDAATSTLMSLASATGDFLISSAPLASKPASGEPANAKGAVQSAAIVENLMTNIIIGEIGIVCKEVANIKPRCGVAETIEVVLAQRL